MRNQKISRKSSASFGNRSLPSRRYPDFFRDAGYRLSQGLKSLEEHLERVLYENPLFHFPYYIALLLFFLTLGLMMPLVNPPKASSFADGIDFPGDAALGNLMLNLDDPMFLLSEDSMADIPVFTPPDTNILAGLQVTDYVVQSGDSISEIAYAHDLELGTIINFNNITNVRRLQVGMELKIPNMDGILYSVQRGESLSAIADKFEVSYESILDANSMESPLIHPGNTLFLPLVEMDQIALKQAMGELFIYPARGRLTSGYGWRNDPFTGIRRFHNGVDLANSVGTRVQSSMEGRIGEVGFHSTYGNYVIINHAGGFQTLYAHLNKFIVRKGQWVDQGQKIGEMGSTGYSTGSHVHFTVFKYNQHVNPMDYLH